METNRAPIYPVEPFTVTETSFQMDYNYRNETTFALSNGYIGTRGTFEEAYPFTEEEGLEGNFINGFYESEDIRYGEWNYGFPTKSQSLLNLPNGKIIRLFLEDEEFDMRKGTVSDYKRVLDMQHGVLCRTLLYTSVGGKSVQLEIKRLVSLSDKNLMVIQYRVIPLNFSGNITFLSALDGNVENHTRTTNPLVDYGPFGSRLITENLLSTEPLLYYQARTKKSGLQVACACSHHLSESPLRTEVETDSSAAGIRYTMKADQGKEIVLEKFIFYTSSLDMGTSELLPFLTGKVTESSSLSYSHYELMQKRSMQDFWSNTDVTIDGNVSLQQGIRFNLFHIMQAAGRDGTTGMGAKGLSGEGYEGHYFWDTEMYVVPVFIYTNPDLAKSLLDYRYHTLNQARERARVLGHPSGALFPWRTINGEEASTYFPLGTAQYHINADISYAFKLYVSVTGDMDYLKEKAAEVLIETARVWADVGCFVKSKRNRYCICAVTGPDEYNAIVDNNFYTNLMARENLRDALWAVETIKNIDPDAHKNLIRKLDLKEEELLFWKRIVENMYFPYDEERDIYPLDDGFMMRKPWNDEKIAPEKRHLLYENFHPLFIFRQKMSKQADAILGMYLHSDLFTEEELVRNYDFYQEVTLHHSSLSTCIFGMVASRIGRLSEAYNYFADSARMDLDDYHDNFYAGIHAANMAGTWQAIVCGFGGLRMSKDNLEIDPILPSGWTRYCFCISFRKSRIEVAVSTDAIKVTLQNDIPAVFTLKQQEIHLTKKGDFRNENL